jgi:hypothetical protein
LILLAVDRESPPCYNGDATVPLNAKEHNQMSDLPQSLDVNLGRTNLLIKQRCGNCKHLKRVAHPQYGQVCAKLGITEISKPCEKFSADPTKIKFKGERHVRNAVDFLQDLSDDKILLFSALLNEETRTRRHGFHFGMTVYILAFGSDCLENYRRMKVVSADSKYVNLQAGDFTAMVYHNSALTSKQWAKKKAELIAQEKRFETSPRANVYKKTTTQAEIRLQKAKVEMADSLDLSMSDDKKFALSSGRLAVTKRRFNDSDKYTPLDRMVMVRTR